jgi:hypothetical protein
MDRPFLDLNNLEEVPLSRDVYQNIKEKVTLNWDILYQHPLIVNYSKYEEDEFSSSMNSLSEDNSYRHHKLSK